MHTWDLKLFYAQHKYRKRLCVKYINYKSTQKGKDDDEAPLFLGHRIFIAFPATKAFNLRSDGSDSRVQSAENVMKGPGTIDKSATGSSSDDSESTGSETGRAEPTEEANKWLTPAENLLRRTR